MIGGEGNQEAPEGKSSLQPGVTPMTKDLKSPEPKGKTSDWLSLAYLIIGLFVLIAALQLYFVLQELIRTWISDQFVPIVSAGYYIVVVVVGIWLIRELHRKQ